MLSCGSPLESCCCPYGGFPRVGRDATIAAIDSKTVYRPEFGVVMRIV
jgi:hypothetical protein